MSKLNDGTIQFDVSDKIQSYDNVHGYYKDDAGNTAFVIQWRWEKSFEWKLTVNNRFFSNTASTGNEGNNKKDKLYIKFVGLEKWVESFNAIFWLSYSVNWGNKNMNECLASRVIVGHMDHSDEDHTPCLAWQRTVGN